MMMSNQPIVFLTVLGHEDEVAPDRRDQCPGDGHKQEGVAVARVRRRPQRLELLLRGAEQGAELPRAFRDLRLVRRLPLGKPRLRLVEAYLKPLLLPRVLPGEGGGCSSEAVGVSA